MSTDTCTVIRDAIADHWIGQHEAALADRIIADNGVTVFKLFYFKRKEAAVLRRIQAQLGKPLTDTSALVWPS